MTTGAKTACRPARTALILSMAARMRVDIAPRAIFGKPEMPGLRPVRAYGPSPGSPAFNALMTRWRASRGDPRRGNPAVSTALHDAAVDHRDATVKSLVTLCAIVVFTVAVGVSGQPPACAPGKAVALAKPKPVMMAEQLLPFRRERAHH